MLYGGLTTEWVSKEVRRTTLSSPPAWMLDAGSPRTAIPGGGDEDGDAVTATPRNSNVSLAECWRQRPLGQVIATVLALRTDNVFLPLRPLSCGTFGILAELPNYAVHLRGQRFVRQVEPVRR